MSSKFSLTAGIALCVVLTACDGDVKNEEDENSGDTPNASPAPTDSPTTIPTEVPTSPTEEPEPSSEPIPAPTLDPEEPPTVAPTPSPEPSPPPVSYSALIQWDIPTTRENGSELLLSEIAGYEVFYKKIDQTEYLKEEIELATISEVTISGLSAGMYQVYITTLDTNGLHSQNSPLLNAEIGD